MKKRPISMTAIIVVAFSFALVVSLVLFFVLIQPRVRNRFLATASTHNYESVLSAEYHLESLLDEQISHLAGVEVAHHSILGAAQVFDDEYYKAVIAENEYIISLEVLDTNNVIMYSSKQDLNREGLDLSGDPLLQLITDQHQTQLGSISYDGDAGLLALRVAYSGEDVTIVGLISIDFFTAYGQDLKQAFDHKELMILNQNGIYIYDSFNNQHLIQNRFSDFEELQELTQDGSVQTMNINGTNSLVSISETERGFWTIVVYESVDQALAANTINNYYYTGTLVFIVVLFILTFGGVQLLIVRETGDLGKSVKAITKGDFNTDLADTRIREFSTLRTEFNNMNDQLKQYTERLAYLAYHDEITELPSKNKAKDDFDVFIKQAPEWTIMYVDIDRFSVVNENYGYDIGDYVIKQVARLLQKHFKHVYRVQGDEFIILEELIDRQDIIKQLVALNSELQTNIKIDRHPISVTIKTGMCRYPDHGEDFDELIQKAVITMHDVRIIGDKPYLCYDDSQSLERRRRSRIELNISRALENDEFHTVFQPIMDVKGKVMRGFESLSRWSSVELGIIRPDEFIPILERTKRIHILDSRVLDDAMKLSNRILEEYGLSLIAAVNISVETIMRSDFVEMVDQALDNNNFDPTRLELEITESTIIQDFDSIIRKMAYLKDKGVRFSEDDFGDAYSSLSYLTRLNIDTLKISRHFLSSLLNSVESRVLIQTILDLSKRLGFETVIEGIEDENTLKLFKKYGCDYVQGYLFYRPMSGDRLFELIGQNQQAKEETS